MRLGSGNTEIRLECSRDEPVAVAVGGLHELLSLSAEQQQL